MMKRFSTLLCTLALTLSASGLHAFGGSVPTGLPTNFGFGAIDKNDNWGGDTTGPHRYKYDQGTTCWDYSYQYLTAGWRTWSAPDGQWPVNELQLWEGRGQRQVFTFYNTTNASLPNTYFSDLMVLMTKIEQNATGKVIIHFEPDFLGFCIRDKGGVAGAPTNATIVTVGGNAAPAGWAGTGARAWNTTNYPNNLIGWAKAIKDMRDLHAPTRVLIAHHFTHWGISSGSVGDVFVNPANQNDVNNMTDNISTFLLNVGGGSSSYMDLFFADPADRDAAWWNLRDGAGGVNSRWNHMNYLTNWGQRSWGTIGYVVDRVSTNLNKRAMMWQVPNGNHFYRAMNNTSGHYQDNYVHSFMPTTNNNGSAGTPGDAYSSSSTAAGPGWWANKGVIGVLFGEGYYGQTAITSGGGDSGVHLTHLRDYGPGDGIYNPAMGTFTNGGGPGGVNVAQGQATSANADNDGGFIRLGVARYCTTGKFLLPGVGTPTHTPSRTPYLGTPTVTPTRTVTPDFISTVFYDGEAATTDAANDGAPASYTYTYQGGGTSTTIADSPTAMHAGVDGLLVHLQTSAGGYAGAGWQRSPAAADARTVDSTGFNAVEFWIRASSASAGVAIGFGSASATPVESATINVAPYVPGGVVDTTWRFATIPLSAFDLGVSGAAAWKAAVGRLIVAAAGMPATFNYDVYIDDMVFVNRPPTPTPSRTMTLTPNPFTSTRTPTVTPTPDTITRMIYDGESAPTNAAGDGVPAQYTYGYPALGTTSFVDQAGTVYAGTQAAAIGLSVPSGGYAGAGWQFSPLTGDARTVDSSWADNLEFYIRGAVGGELISVVLGDNSGSFESSPIGIAPYIIGGPGVTTGWQRVVMPLSLFNVGASGAAAWRTQLGRLVFTADSSSGAPPSFTYNVFIDDVMITKRPYTATPTITRTSTASPSRTRTPSPTPSATRSASPSATATTLADTATATPTASPSRTASVTRTGTPTHTPQADTATATPTRTPTLVPDTATPSATRTGTRTSTPSATPSGTRSATLTISVSPTDVPPGSSATPTGTISPTFTRTATPSTSPTQGASQTATPSASPSATQTAVSSLTFSPSSSSTSTPSRTATATATPTVTLTASQSLTATPSFTAVPTGSSATVSPTISPTFTASPADSATATPVDTATHTAVSTGTFTPTVTRTATPVDTPQGTLTQTPTRTHSPQPTASPTPLRDAWDPADDSAPGATLLTFAYGPTPQNHGTHVLSAGDPGDWFRFDVVAGERYHFLDNGTGGDAMIQVYSDAAGTLVASDDNSNGGTRFALDVLATSTGTWYARVTDVGGAGWSGGSLGYFKDPAASPTVTATRTPGNPGATPSAPGPLEFEASSPLPNPVIGILIDKAVIAVKLKGDADTLTLKVYSRAMTLLGSRETGPRPSGWTHIKLPDDFIAQAGNGTYFYVISGTRGDAKTVKDALGKITVLR